MKLCNMHFPAAVIGIFLAASGAAIALPQPDINIYISLPEGHVSGDSESLGFHIAGLGQAVPVHQLIGDEEDISQQRIANIASSTSKFIEEKTVLSDAIHRLGGDDSVHYPSSNSEFDSLFTTSGKLVVVMFTAEWCGPCRAIAPKFAQYSNRYQKAVFVSADIDKLSTLDQAKNVRSIPTFKFYRDENLVSEFSGASSARLQHYIEANL
ncbi:thioredoxine 2, partial [Diplocarpon rosae]